MTTSLRATVLNCTLKPSPEPSSTEALVDVVRRQLDALDVECGTFRLADHAIPPGVSTRVDGVEDDWPVIHRAILSSQVVVVATPTWVGHPSSLAQRALERMDAMISETADDGRPVAYDKVAGVVVTGNEDGAHHVISQVAQGLIDIGFTVPGQAWTYWNRGPGPGPTYLDTDEGHDWSGRTGRTMAANLAAVGRALADRPLPAPPSE